MIQADKFGLSARIIGALRSVFARHAGIQKVILYGSRAKGNFRPGSDIDLVMVASGLGNADVLAIQGEIDDLLLPYKVDLSLYHQITSPDLIDHISRVCVEF